MSCKKAVVLAGALALALDLSGCQTLAVLDARLSARLQRASWLKPTHAWVVRGKAGSVALRQSPDPDRAVIRQLQPGEVITPLGTVDDWRAVRVGETTGFVRAREVRAITPPTGLFAAP
ncbi:MAG: SH3 domain-containing protein [Candidatus Competibacteraceae bacterium]|nr:SH3 domain-containing protein [Candidatus Competibacteraceae bacterium]